MARLYQDFAFEVNEVVGRSLIRLCGLVENDVLENSPIVVFAWFDHPLEWHRFFLDAGAAFWETWPDAVIANEQNEHDDDDTLRLVNYFDDLLPRLVKRAYAYEISASTATRIKLQLDGDYYFQLACRDDIYEDPTIISLEKK